MKKTVVASVMMALAVALLAGGCATGPKGPTDQEMIQTSVKTFTDGLLGKDINKMMSAVSEKFYHPEAGDKAAAKDLLQQGIDSGFTEGGKIDLAKMEIKIDAKKNTATAYPIGASAPQGSVTVGLTLQKEVAGKTANWLITGIDVEGI